MGHLAHFYHLKAAPSCKFYSKSENHLIAQLELEKKFPKGEVLLEKPFAQINRIADACWEKEKIIFEIQCSMISEKEAEMRLADYRSIGYEVVFLLDDNCFNRWILRPAEKFLRQRGAYFLLTRGGIVYDQFELFFENKRVKRGQALLIDLQRPFFSKSQRLDEALFPKQLIERKAKRYFCKDALDFSLRFPQKAMDQKKLEEKFANPRKIKNLLIARFQKYVVQPYLRWLQRCLRKR